MWRGAYAWRQLAKLKLETLQPFGLCCVRPCCRCWSWRRKPITATAIIAMSETPTRKTILTTAYASSRNGTSRSRRRWREDEPSLYPFDGGMWHSIILSSSGHPRYLAEFYPLYLVRPL